MGANNASLPAIHQERAAHPVRILAALLSGLLLLALGACTTNTARKANFDRCLANERSCDASLLTASEQQRLFDLKSQQHFQDCLAGLRCNAALLSEAQLAAVRDAYAQRTFSGCMNTVGTLVGCNPDDLSAEQRDLVRRRNLAVNFFLCANAILGCDESLLTSEQRARIAAGPPE